MKNLLKQLKGLDIDLRNFHSLLNRFYPFIKILTELVIAQIILSLLLLLFFFDSISLSKIVFIILAESLFFIAFLIRIRKGEISKITSIIKTIREKNIKSHTEISLPQSLATLESEIKLMYKKNSEDIEYLKKLERMRTEFLANVSHELRTPIFAIQGYLETLLNGAIKDERVNIQFLEKANRHTLNLNNLLNDLIDISMIESGEMRMSFRYFDITEFINQIISEFQPMSIDKNISLVFNSPQKKLQLFGDKNRLKQAIGNLIQNGIKYTDHGSVAINIEEAEKIAKIVVKDTGIGIPQADLERIFERFYRVDKARSRDVGGTGLGLAIVKHIIDAHGSQICVKSEPGKGSEFSFTLKK
jgi:two-component system phosphate regulon sensor histidine kinase PhoR